MSSEALAHNLPDCLFIDDYGDILVREDIKPGTPEWFRADRLSMELQGYDDDEIRAEHERLMKDIDEEAEVSGEDRTPETPGKLYWKLIQVKLLAQDETDLNAYELTEDEAGRFFVDALQEYFRFNTTEKGFMIWTGTHWTADRWRLAERAAAVVGKIYQSKLSTIQSNSIREAATFVKKLRSSTGVKSILFFASSDPRITTSQEDYDRNPDLLNTPGGTVELESGLLRDHRRGDLLTKITRYAPDWTRKPVIFDTFFSNLTMHRQDLMDAHKRYLGSGCSGKTPKDKLSIHYGDGGNCKTVLLEAVGDCLGSYAASLDIKALTVGERGASGHTDEIAALDGIRYVVCAESNQSLKLDEAKVKKYTGGDTIPVSRKHGRTFDMMPAFTLNLLTNHKPRVTGRDVGIWRRATLFPYDYHVPPEEKDLNYKKKMLAADGPCILAWLIDGCRLWYEQGYGKFETVEAATDEYRKEEDIIGTFLDESCELDRHYSVQASTLREAYEAWCRENGEHVFSGRAWGAALREHGFTKRHGMYGKAWEGLQLKNEGKNDA